MLTKSLCYTIYLNKLFEIFKKDFVDSRLSYDGKPVLFDNREINNYPACFWHLITENKIDNCDRISEENISLLRCKRICWIRPIIENHADDIPTKEKLIKERDFTLSKRQKPPHKETV